MVGDSSLGLRRHYFDSCGKFLWSFFLMIRLVGFGGGKLGGLLPIYFS